MSGRPLRYNTQQARDLFNKYGYMPTDNFEFVGINKTYRVLDEVKNKYIDKFPSRGNLLTVLF